MSERTILNTANVDPKALVAIAGFHADIVGEVQRAVTASPIVVVGMAQNPVVRKARKALDTAGVAYKYLEYGTYSKCGAVGRRFRRCLCKASLSAARQS
jgi:monothiol glutaredoxin